MRGIVGIRALKGKRLELSTPNLAHVYSTAVARQVLTHRSKGQRSRSHGYENRRGRMAASEVCCCGRAAWYCKCMLLYVCLGLFRVVTCVNARVTLVHVLIAIKRRLDETLRVTNEVCIVLRSPNLFHCDRKQKIPFRKFHHQPESVLNCTILLFERDVNIKGTRGHTLRLKKKQSVRDVRRYFFHREW